MITKFTWPNFHGNAVEGTKAIIEHMGFQNDVKYGKSKIFIRSPQTLFSLEEERDKFIPHIILFLQKVWRGGNARCKARKMRAIYLIMSRYRRYKLRAYISQIITAFRNVKTMKDYGKSIKWPAPPKVLDSWVKELKKAHNRWRANMILKKVPREEWPALQLKCTAHDTLKGQRSDWGMRRKWEGNYLNTTRDNPSTVDFETKMNSLKSHDGFSKILFSSFCKKVNKHNQCADRAVVLTDKGIYKLDPKKKYKPMRAIIPFQEVSGLSISPDSDQLIVFHLTDGNDLVVCLSTTSHEERVGEVVGIVARTFQKIGKPLQLNVNKQPKCNLGNKSRQLVIKATAANGGPVFKKDGPNLALMWPTS